MRPGLGQNENCCEAAVPLPKAQPGAQPACQFQANFGSVPEVMQATRFASLPLAPFTLLQNVPVASEADSCERLPDPL